MSGETPSFDSVPLESVEAIQKIVQKMQDVESFNRLRDDAQVRIAKKIHKDPVGFAMHTLQTVENGLKQEDPLLSEAEVLLNLSFKVACEYGNNPWLASKISHCIAALNTGEIAEVRAKVLEVLSDK